MNETIADRLRPGPREVQRCALEIVSTPLTFNDWPAARRRGGHPARPRRRLTQQAGQSALLCVGCSGRVYGYRVDFGGVQTVVSLLESKACARSRYANGRVAVNSPLG